MRDVDDRQRLLELLADRALGALDPAEESELASLLEKHPDIGIHDMDHLVRDLGAALAEEPPTRARPARRDRTGASRVLARIGWQEWAAAAVVLVGVLVGIQVGLPLLYPVQAEQRRIEASRERLLDADATIRPFIAWGGSASPLIRGDVVWSPSRQEGVARFEGLAENNPDKIRYRITIHTPTGDRVTAKVFDAAKVPGDWLVRFESATPVQARAFEVTLESVSPTGGVYRRVAITETP